MEGIPVWLIIGLVVAVVFGAFARKKKKPAGQTKVIIVNADGDETEGPSGPSAFGRFIRFVVAAVLGFATAGLIIVFGLEPQMGPIDPFSPISIGLILVCMVVYLGIFRMFSR